MQGLVEKANQHSSTQQKKKVHRLGGRGGGKREVTRGKLESNNLESVRTKDFETP